MRLKTETSIKKGTTESTFEMSSYVVQKKGCADLLKLTHARAHTHTHKRISYGIQCRTTTHSVDVKTGWVYPTFRYYSTLTD
jgi:hypothetical protein